MVMQRGMAVASVVVMMGLVACGDGDPAATGSATLKASEGGTVQVAGEATRLEVPAAALARDTSVELRIAAPSEFGALPGGRPRALVLAPEGTVLATPATVLLDAGGPTIAAGQRVSIVQFVDGGWRAPELASAELAEGGLVRARLGLFAPTAVVVSDVASGPTGSVRGSVLDFRTERPLSGVTVRVMGAAGELGRAVSNATGNFLIPAIPVGSHSVRVDLAPGQNCGEDPTQKAITVLANQTADILFGFTPCQ